MADADLPTVSFAVTVTRNGPAPRAESMVAPNGSPAPHPEHPSTVSAWVHVASVGSAGPPR
jgi:hypothetical protein